MKQADQLSKKTRCCAQKVERYHAVSASAKKDSSDADANAPTRISALNRESMPSSADRTTKPTSSAAIVETASAVNVTAICAKIPKKSLAVSSVSAITSRATDTTQFSARESNMASASAGNANVTTDGVEMHASAVLRLKRAKRLTVKSVPVMVLVVAENASAKLKMKSDIREDIARSAQHVLAVVMN